ncbi:MAG: hypothetical protein HRT53_07210 [Colwellia sp.]|nr:hypothetical protein [Colwellia sp.]
MRKIFIASACLLTTFLAAPSFEASAAAARTTCTYTLVAGAPWADKYRVTSYSGHIKCPGEIIGGIGYWRMTNEVHS